MRGVGQKLRCWNQIGALNSDTAVLLAFRRALGFGRLLWLNGSIRVCGLIQRMEGNLGLFQDVATIVFPKAQKKERQSGGQSPELGFARDFCLGFPPE